MPDESTSLFARLVDFGFQQLYTRLAWTYDLVAAGVSFGEWQSWGRCAIPHLRGRRVLELAHGPGHLHLSLRRLGYAAAAIDLSWQMGVNALDRLERAGLDGTLARADARHLPFPDRSFDSLVSTFPTRFIFEPEALSEARRVLARGGALVVVPGAAWTGTRPAERLAGSLLRATSGRGMPLEEVRGAFEEAGFGFHVQHADTRRARVFVWVCPRTD